MKIHEYQSKDLFRNYNIPTPNGKVFTQLSEVEVFSNKIENYPVVVKAQVHAGGRGKAGGVKLSKSKQEVLDNSQSILGMNLITKQTGEKGIKVNTILIENGVDIQRELYLSLLADRQSASVLILASTEGGMDIEEVAEKTPDKILKVKINPSVGVSPFHIRELVYGLQLENSKKELGLLIQNLYNMFIENDCSMVEINPLIVNSENELVALDAKVDIDNNALYRQSKLEELFDPSETDALEYEASKIGLNYINVDDNGSIASMVNGAGLAMATMDAIKFAGGTPSNFLDVGGNATSDMIAKALELILKDKNVKAILINIFGGILRCDILAEGIVKAIQVVDLNVPTVIRLKGTNSEIGKEILDKANLDLHSVDTLDEASKLVVKLSKL